MLLLWGVGGDGDGSWGTLLSVLVDQSSGGWQESQTQRDWIKGCVKLAGAPFIGVDLGRSERKSKINFKLSETHRVIWMGRILKGHLVQPLAMVRDTFLLS